MPIRLASIAAAAALSVPALAQTTWTSFEDRKGHAIASDPTGGVLMFGGEASTSSGKLLKDTNSFATTGAGSSLTSTWLKLNPFGSPTARTEHAMASGVGTNDTAIFVLFGGFASQTSGPALPSNETFVYEGGGWGKVTLAAAPSARAGHTLVTDPIRNLVLLFGGSSNGFAQNDTWEFDPAGQTWQQIIASGVPTSPPPRFDHAMVFHPGFGGTTGRFYLCGGAPFFADTWEYDPNAQNWTNVTPASAPSGRRRASMSYLTAFGNVVMFGGEDNTLTPSNETWIWDRFAGTWTLASPAASPPARFNHAMAPDQIGNHLVLLGGEDGGGQQLTGTWLWNGVNWIEQLPPPSPREGVAMTYDSGNDHHPMFGGRAIPGGADLDQTWELEGLNWREKSPSNKPSARADAGIVYDSVRNRTVLYGGRSGGACGTELGDTWEWDGQNWAPRAPANNPPAAGGVQPVFDTALGVTWMLVGSDMWSYDGNDWSQVWLPDHRAQPGFAYDSARGRLVVTCGSTVGVANTDTTWEWDGTSWHDASGPPGPTARRTGRMVFDQNTGTCVLFGGGQGTTPTLRLGDTWLWNGTTWQAAAGGPTGRSDGSFAYDALGQKALLFGGTIDVGGGNSGPTSETNEWDGTSWIGVPGPLPSARTAATLQYDEARGEIIMFGGRTGSADFSDTWRFDGATWTQLSTATSPPGRAESEMAFDPSSNSLLLFGGYSWGNSVYMGDTWLWNGSTWIPQTPLGQPSPRYGHVLVNDGNRVLLWGGWKEQPGGGSSLPTTTAIWAWDGTDWSVVDSGKPSPRTNYGATYDSQRDRTIVFGGREDCGSGNYLDETWEWNGGSWLQRFPTNAPSPRERSKLTFDEARGRVVLFGGTDGTNTFSDTWEWDGDDWISRLPASSPPGSAGHGLTFDQQRKVTVAFGSAGSWDYGPEFPANIELYGSGCLGPNGVPALEPKPWAGPWLGGRIEVDLVNAPSNGLGIFVWGFSETFWSGLPLPLDLGSFVGGAAGCQLYASADLTQIFLAGTNPYISFVLPTQPVMNGVRMRAQAGFLPVGSPPVVSNALRMTFGSK